jgi:hypothetical protein
MHFATLNHIHLTKTPDFDLASQITFDEDGARRLWQIEALAFESSGKRHVVHLTLFAGATVNIPERLQAVSVTAASSARYRQAFFRLLIHYPAIPAVEERAKLYKGMARGLRGYESYKIPVWTEEKNIEMITRILVRRDFSSLLGNSLSLPDLEELKRVLFGIVYPSFGCTKWVKRK